MTILDTYYNAITREILTQVELVGNLIEHHGLRGSGNERILHDLLIGFPPKRFAVGSGVVIDTNGNQSRQCDLIIYDCLYHPSLLQQHSAVLFPVESVLATIEIKTTLRSGDIVSIVQNSQSVKRLTFVDEQIPYLDLSAGNIDFRFQRASSPMTFFVAYDADFATLDGLATAVRDRMNAVPSAERPTTGIVIRAGMVFRHHQVPEAGPDELIEAGIFPLLMPGREEQGEWLSITGPDSTASMWPYNGFHYPVYDYRGQRALMDPARAFLSFLLGLLRCLDAKKLTQRPFYGEYVPQNYSRYEVI